MPQHEYMERFQKEHGRRFDHEERQRKREARMAHKVAKFAKKAHGIRAKLFQQRRYKEKATMKKTISMNSERNARRALKDEESDVALPTYLLDRQNTTRAKILSNSIKQKRKEKAGKWSVPIPKIKPVSDEEMFRVVKTGKRKKKAWKRMVLKPTFVGENFTRKPPKYERFVRPSALRYRKAHVTHPELQTTFQLDIIGVKKNPSSKTYTQLGVITKGTIIEVNVSELGLVTPGGKIVWGKYAQVTNRPDMDGCINAVLLV
jgi:ribosome biogenesis protein NSA2